tara:strand:+ start:45 stop:611 length:567 start_codon:yes stop_codon:yes gene_type:complete
MADADKFIIKCHASPQVLIDSSEGTGDAASKFAIHEDTGNVGGTITILGTEATGTARWYYEPNRQVGTGDTTLPHAGVNKYTDGTTYDINNDIVMGLYIRHKGVNNAGEATTDSITIYPDSTGGGGAGASDISLKPGEAIAVRIPTTSTANGTVASGETNTILNNLQAETSASDTVMIEMLLFVDDVA